MLDSERHHDRQLQLHNNRHRSFLKYAKVRRGRSIWFLNDLVAKDNYNDNDNKITLFRHIFIIYRIYFY